MSDSDDGATSSTLSYDGGEPDWSDSGLDYLADGWDDPLDTDCADSAASTGTYGPKEQSPYEWLVEQENRESIAAAAGILESCFIKNKRLAGHSSARSSQLYKRQRTCDAFVKTVAIRGLDGQVFTVTPSRTLPTRRHRLSFMLLVTRARTDPTSFTGAQFLSVLNDDIVWSIVWNADEMMDNRSKIVGLARSASETMYLERRGITDEDATAAFTYTRSTPPRPSTLYLNNNRFGAAGAVSLGAAFSREWGPNQYWHIKYLSLNNTPIGADGAVTILSALSTGWNGDRAVIEMADIGLCGEEEGMAVAHAIKANAGRLHVKGINLSHNAIGAGGLRAVADAACHISGLNYMKLCCCGATPVECEEISRLISETTTVDSPVMAHDDPRFELRAGSPNWTPIRKGVEIHTHPNPMATVKQVAVSSVAGRSIRIYQDVSPPHWEYMCRMVTRDLPRLRAFFMDDMPWQFSINAGASFTDVFMTMVACAQAKNVASYIAPAVSRLEHVTLDSDTGCKTVRVLTGSVTDYSNSGTSSSSWADGFGALKLGPLSSLRLIVVPAGETMRLVAIVFALEQAAISSEGSLPFPKDIVMEIFKWSAKRVVAVDYRLRTSKTSH